MFSCEFGEISKNTFFHRTPLVATSVKLNFMLDFTTKLSNCYYKLCQVWCITKWGKYDCYYNVQQLFCIRKRGRWYWKVEQTGITKWNNFHYKVRQVLQTVAAIMKLHNYYKVGQYNSGF